MHSYVLLLSLLSTIYAQRRCLLHRGRCVSHCPRYMHAYHTRCDGQTLSQKTCDSPLAQVIGYSCGWSRCDCNGNYILDEQTKLCVKEADCQQYSTKGPKTRDDAGHRKHPKRRYHLSKRIRIKEEDETEQD